MSLDGRYTAVLDRFEGDQAVLLLESDGEVVQERLVDEDDLPADARHQDAVLLVTLDSGNLRAVEHDPDETEKRRADAQDRFDRLSQRPPSTDDECAEDTDPD